jgi:hypothetical protein
MAKSLLHPYFQAYFTGSFIAVSIAAALCPRLLLFSNRKNERKRKRLMHSADRQAAGCATKTS